MDQQIGQHGDPADLDKSFSDGVEGKKPCMKWFPKRIGGEVMDPVNMDLLFKSCCHKEQQSHGTVAGQQEHGTSVPEPQRLTPLTTA